MRYAWFLVCLVGCGQVEKIPVDADSCTGTCECRVDSDCAGAHAVCDDQVTSRTCACAAGYMPGLSGACEWVGVVKDPGFQSAPAWTTEPDVTVNVNLNETGMIEPGAVRFTNNGLCNLERLTQEVTMPRLSRAEPLVAVMTYRFQGSKFGGGPAFAIGQTWHDDLPFAFSNWTTSRVCLGASQYAPESTQGKGAPLALAMMPAAKSVSCTTDAIDVDHFEIKPADPGECPLPGTALNGDAEGMGGWRFVAQGANGTVATGMIENGVGEGNTRGARLFVTNRCGNTQAIDRISFPDASTLASPALSFYNKSSTGSQVFVGLGPTSLPTIGGTNVGTTQRLCIPAFMRGAVYDFSSSIDGSGTCADVVNFESIYDNVKLVNDPSCGTDTTITDPGFESPLVLVGASSTPGKSIARALVDPNMAHSGNGVLQLGVTVTCFAASWQANVITPPSNGGGPALKFFYRTGPPVQFRFGASSVGTTFTAMTDNQWHEGVSCLNPKLVGRNQTVTFSESFVGGTCNTTVTQETALIDDLRVTTDPTCPM